MTENYDTALIVSSSAKGLNLPLVNGSAYSLPLDTQLLNVEAYRVKTVDIPRTFYTIKTGALVFGLQGNVTGSQNIAIPAGNYSAVQLSNYIAAAWFTLTATTITLDFLQPNFKLRITRTGGADATIAITATELALAGMSSILGFYSAIPAATVLNASNVFRIYGPTEILVCSAALNLNLNQQSVNPLTTGLGGKFKRSNVIYMMPNYGNTGSFNNGIIPNDWQIFQTPQNLNKIDLYLEDMDLTPIDLNGYPWGIAIEFRMKRGVQ
jgi:hypothetical protein